MKPPYDLQVISEVLEGMTPSQRREWFVKIKMAEHQKTYRDIATRHRFSAWLLASAVNGQATWTPRIVNALQSDLAVDLTPFLTEREAAKLARSK
jgi:hypothetical protein